ncbi:FAD-binding oxidoreductase [Halorubellus sp. JP-L1]|uniref:FAD-binding oxidoreductase n=1 Tax=Halorubellus sp. JP-L1 TaxID=2715753 RepID=UPI00140AC9B2|nr:FAD-binding oxidoreductase [Halorubellus sp. JP-L1]NHN40951.1 FAD-binding oxidoreductase [Halorubellus sp. JP-L1]
MTEGTNDYDCAFLADVLPEDRVSFDDSRREQFAMDASVHDPVLPDAVVWPTSTSQVSDVLSAAHERGVPVTPWSGGSGLEGGGIPVEGGIVLNVKEMAGVEVEPGNLQATVGPGIVYDDLNEELAKHGLRFPPGISSGDIATIGGMIATNASGFNAVKYGETRDHVRRLEVVLPDGDVIECGRGVVKTSSGYSLKDLFVGSEGTFGVVTEATIAVSGIPEHERAALVTFPSRNQACAAVADVIGAGLVPAAIEFMDTLTVELVNEYRDSATFTEQPTLILEFHANNSGIEEDVAFARGICEDHDAASWDAPGAGEMDAVWSARRDVLPAYRAHGEDLEPAMLGDVVVPISNYPEMVEAVATASEEFDVLTPCVGHAGDGNLHYAPLVPEDDDAARERASELHERVVETAIDLGGTATGEHGVGLGKRKFMRREHGGAVELMRTLKDAVDPAGTMNPGKVVPDRDDAVDED